MDNPEKQNKKHNTLCVGHHHTQDEDLHNKKVDEKIPRQRCKNRNKMYNYGIQYFYLFFNFKFNIIISLTAWMQADQFISMPV
jgi:hypothetical protein